MQIPSASGTRAGHQPRARRRRAAWRTLALLVALLGTQAPGLALACGLPLSARIPAEQALISFANGREEIITSVQIAADRPGAAVIFPVPSAPEVTALNDNELFDYLADVTRPQVETREIPLYPGTEEPAGAAPGGGVSLLGREVLGGYDVARLAADDPGALGQWLDQHGYTVPDGAEPILKAYVDDGWKFVAVKLAGTQSANGSLAPLRLAFDSPRIVYPMRLGQLADGPLDVLLYVLAEHRAKHDQMPTEYAGPVAALDRPPPAALAGLFRAPYLTKLRNTRLEPRLLGEDFVIGQAANDAPFRLAETRNVYVRRDAPAPLGRSMAGPILGVALVFLASTLALGLAFGLRKRINAIAGPDPNEEDD